MRQRIHARRVKRAEETAAPSSGLPVASRAVHTTSPFDSVLRMQQTLGNRATARALAPRAPRAPRAATSVQRHSSFEHRLMGDADPKALGESVTNAETRKHVLQAEMRRLQVFQHDPTADPTKSEEFRDVRWVQLKGSQLWVSYGELNALGDYMPNPETIDTGDAALMVPVIQRMRRSIAEPVLIRILEADPETAEVGKFLDDHNLLAMKFEGEADEKGLDRAVKEVSPAAGEVGALNDATASLGADRYQGLLSRNACHFAPFSWERWALYHNQARDFAKQHFLAKGNTAPVKNVPVDTDEPQRQAWLNNGYADHFIQDSFAAGHLINKTLVMQWFSEYTAKQSWWDGPWYGTPDDDTLESVSEKNQPGAAERYKYDAKSVGQITSGSDREQGQHATDPQTAHERQTHEQRVAGSGIVGGDGNTQEENYQNFQDMLNSAYISLAAGGIHDFFNDHGLSVRNAAGVSFRVGGDGTFFEKSNSDGAQAASEAAHKSQQAIEELLASGTTSVSADDIFAYVPRFVDIDIDVEAVDAHIHQTYGLEDFQDAIVKQICYTAIFPEMMSMKNKVVRAAGPTLIDPDQLDGRSKPKPSVSGARGFSTFPRHWH